MVYPSLHGHRWEGERVSAVCMFLHMYILEANVFSITFRQYVRPEMLKGAPKGRVLGFAGAKSEKRVHTARKNNKRWCTIEKHFLYLKLSTRDSSLHHPRTPSVCKSVLSDHRQLWSSSGGGERRKRHLCSLPRAHPPETSAECSSAYMPSAAQSHGQSTYTLARSAMRKP